MHKDGKRLENGTHFIALPAKVRSKEKLMLRDAVDVSFEIRQRA
jgi:hypothetical protein